MACQPLACQWSMEALALIIVAWMEDAKFKLWAFGMVGREQTPALCMRDKGKYMCVYIHIYLSIYTHEGVCDGYAS